MKTLICMICWFMTTVLQAGEVIIHSFSENGLIAFDEVSEALNYRIEWSHSLGGGWTNFTGDLGQWLDNIPASGEGVITAYVPMFYRVVARMHPQGMILIPSGTFMMGNATNLFSPEEGDPNELPQHEVYTDAFYIDQYEVTDNKWQEIRFASVGHLGYLYSNLWFDSYSEKPMTQVAWHDAIKWCNARSEIEGLTPVYYTDPGFDTIYKTGLFTPFADWSANGYRLPTEAEWEKAARGGKPDLRFPWSDYSNKISHAKANYYAGGFEYDLSNGDHPDFTFLDRRSPVGHFAPNDYVLYDMAGNACEWVWDWHDDNYYSVSPQSNPKGPEIGTFRVLRGGSHITETKALRLSCRLALPQDFLDYHLLSEVGVGFRCVRRP